jgi:hypothetical protein
MTLRINAENPDDDKKHKKMTCGACTAYDGTSEWRGYCQIKKTYVYGIMPICRHCPNVERPKV